MESYDFSSPILGRPLVVLCLSIGRSEFSVAKGEWYIIRRYYKTNLDTPHLLYIVGGASKVRERFHLHQSKLCMAKEVIEM